MYIVVFFLLNLINHHYTLMEQEVQVTIHSNNPKNPEEELSGKSYTPEQTDDISETVSKAVSCFRNSESYTLLLNGIEKARAFIKNKPEQAMLYSLGAGALFGLFLKRKR